MTKTSKPEKPGRQSGRESIPEQTIQTQDTENHINNVHLKAPDLSFYQLEHRLEHQLELKDYKGPRCLTDPGFETWLKGDVDETDHPEYRGCRWGIHGKEWDKTGLQDWYGITPPTCNKMTNEERIGSLRGVTGAFVELMKKAGIKEDRWALDAGTLLGAVRCGDVGYHFLGVFFSSDPCVNMVLYVYLRKL